MSKFKNIFLFSIIPIYLYLSNKNIKSKSDKQKDKIIKTNILKDDLSGKTILSVSKKVSEYWDKENINVYENEKKWLIKLQDSDIIAKYLHFDDIHRIITTEYVGEKITKNNIPYDWEQQRDNIISTLKKYNCRHNDIKPDEIIVLNGKIKIIDFGWAYPLNKDNPSNYPSGLGNSFRCNEINKKYDDKCSFNKSINYIKNLN